MPSNVDPSEVKTPLPEFPPKESVVAWKKRHGSKPPPQELVTVPPASIFMGSPEGKPIMTRDSPFGRVISQSNNH